MEYFRGVVAALICMPSEELIQQVDKWLLTAPSLLLVISQPHTNILII
jgi:hypothetical protein